MVELFQENKNSIAQLRYSEKKVLNQILRENIYDFDTIRDMAEIKLKSN